MKTVDILLREPSQLVHNAEGPLSLSVSTASLPQREHTLLHGNRDNGCLSPAQPSKLCQQNPKQLGAIASLLDLH